MYHLDVLNDFAFPAAVRITGVTVRTLCWHASQPWVVRELMSCLTGSGRCLTPLVLPVRCPCRRLRSGRGSLRSAMIPNAGVCTAVWVL